ncbi:MAG: DUF4238 domain-containing protein [Syntrophaceae bacterium]|nr:DUF4238 domain-containing protein [Syntrophaceae bacterium]
MPFNKKHHYVPKFYLKRFTDNSKSINIFNIPSLRIIENASLKNECYKDYFYGEDLKFEKALSILEGKTAKVLQDISISNKLPPFPSPQYIVLLINVIMQEARTKFAADQIDELVDKNMKHLLEIQNGITQDDLSKIKIGLKKPARMAVSVAAQCHLMAMDLKCKLLTIGSNREFITSDNPVVYYNQYLEYRTFASNTGIASKGLEIFYPIDHKHLIVYYDADVYIVGNKKDKVIKLKKRRDIEMLNKLQYVNAGSNIYFHEKHPNFSKLKDLSSKYRRKQKASFKAFVNEEKSEIRNELMGSSKEDVRIELNLSFIKVLRKAKKWRKKLQKQKEQPAVLIRNMQLYEKYHQFQELVKKGVYNSGDFHRFLFSGKLSQEG